MNALESSYKALKNLVTIIMGIAILNTVNESFVHLFDNKHGANEKLEFVFLGLSLTFLTFRFYHGNIRTLDASMEGTLEAYRSSFGRFLDLITILFQGCLFSIIGLMLRSDAFSHESLVKLLLFIFASDLLLVAIEAIFASLSTVRKGWVLLNVVAAAWLGAGLLFTMPLTQTIISAVLLTSLAEYFFNWDFYFKASKNL